jgi:hypothetical protein
MLKSFQRRFAPHGTRLCVTLPLRDMKLSNCPYRHCPCLCLFTTSSPKRKPPQISLDTMESVTVAWDDKTAFLTQLQGGRNNLASIALAFKRFMTW